MLQIYLKWTNLTVSVTKDFFRNFNFKIMFSAITELLSAICHFLEKVCKLLQAFINE